MTTTIHTSHLSVGHRTIAMQAADVAELRGRIAHVLGLGDEATAAGDGSVSRAADVLVVADNELPATSADDVPNLAPDGWLVLWGDCSRRR